MPLVCQWSMYPSSLYVNNENGNEYMFMGIEMNTFMEVLLP